MIGQRPIINRGNFTGHCLTGIYVLIIIQTETSLDRHGKFVFIHLKTSAANRSLAHWGWICSMMVEDIV